MTWVKQNSDKLFFVAVAVLFTVLMGTLFSRAEYSYFWYDEAYSYRDYSLDSFREIILDQNGCCPANNHVINSLAMKLMIFLGLDSQLGLRLPNLLSFPIYFFSIFFLLRSIFYRTELKHKRFIVLILLFIGTSYPLVFEFFFQARGYGIATAFMALALCLFVTNSSKKLVLIGATLAMAVSALANLALVNLYLAFLGIIFLVCLLEKSWRACVGLLLLNALPLAYLVYRALLISAPGVPIYASDDGFLMGTLLSLIKDGFYIKTSVEIRNLLTLILLVVNLVILASVVKSVFKLMRNILHKNLERTRSELIKCTIPLAYILMVVAMHIQVYVLDSQFIIGRTASFMIPLMLIAVVIGLRNLEIKFRHEKFLIACLVFALFLAVANLYAYYTRPFIQTSETKLQANFLSNYVSENGEKSVAVHDVWFPSVEFYSPDLVGKMKVFEQPELSSIDQKIVLIHNSNEQIMLAKGYHLLMRGTSLSIWQAE